MALFSTEVGGWGVHGYRILYPGSIPLINHMFYNIAVETPRPQWKNVWGHAPDAPKAWLA